jgi:hypothetical protein
MVEPLEPTLLESLLLERLPLVQPAVEPARLSVPLLVRLPLAQPAVGLVRWTVPLPTATGATPKSLPWPALRVPLVKAPVARLEAGRREEVVFPGETPMVAVEALLHPPTPLAAVEACLHPRTPQ